MALGALDLTKTQLRVSADHQHRGLGIPRNRPALPE